LVRDRGRLSGRSWLERVDVVEGDVGDPATLTAALDQMDAAYYLVHSMCSGPDFATRDRELATRFANAASHLHHVVYLGGITPEEDAAHTSEHLGSRAEVGRILRTTVPTTELRAGPIIGSGSASFEMVRYLTERLPAMVTPRWVLNQVQPIAVRDILSYLVGVLDHEPLGVLDVGGEVLTFKDMMHGYADVRELPRVIVPLPILAPGLAALWVGLVTPIPNCLAVPLVRGMVRPVVGEVERSRALFPQIHPLPYREAVSLALERTEEQNVQTRWSDALGSDEAFRLEDREGLAKEVRTRLVPASAEAVFRSFASIGGARGWLVWDWAWRLRGLADQIVGGPGLRRGRRHPTDLYPGEALDFWRVEEVDAPRVLRLRAEMKVPGQAWLQFEASQESGGTRLIQAALFRPRGFFGWLYWYAMYPAHAVIFDAMIDRIASDAVAMDREAESS